MLWYFPFSKSDDPWVEEEPIQNKGLLDGSAVLPLLEFLTDDLLATTLSLATQEQFPALGVLVEHSLHNP